MAYLYSVTLTRLKQDGTGKTASLATVKSIGPRGARSQYPDMPAVMAALPRQLLPAWKREAGESGEGGLWYGSREAADVYHMTLKNTRGLPIARLEFRGYEFND